MTSQVDSRCAELVNEGNKACNDVMGQITERFNQLTNEVTVEVRKQCDSTKLQFFWILGYYADIWAITSTAENP